MAIDLAQRFESDLHLVHVMQPSSLTHATYGGPGTAAPAVPVSMLELREIAESALRDVAAEVESECRRIEMHVIESANIPEAICEVAEKVAADLIVMGTHGPYRPGPSIPRKRRGANDAAITMRGAHRARRTKPPSMIESTARHGDDARGGRAARASGIRRRAARAQKAFSRCASAGCIRPRTLIVDEIVRFKGESDPADEAVLFALRSRDGTVRTAFVATCGPSADR